jgi:hypothetical protein
VSFFVLLILICVLCYGLLLRIEALESKLRRMEMHLPFDHDGDE